jgi:hypothetical protein
MSGYLPVHFEVRVEGENPLASMAKPEFLQVIRMRHIPSLLHTNAVIRI